LRLKDKVALITGASMGIGRSIALTYVREGAKVVLMARTAAALNDLAREIEGFKGDALVSPGDVTRPEDARRTVDATLKRFGRIDILLNDAGILGSKKDLDELSEADWDEVMNVNVKGCFFLSREVIPVMRRQKSGNIINISSGAGERHPQLIRARSILYNVSKFTVEGLTFSVASRMQGTGVNVNALKPGPIMTHFFADASEEELERIRKALGAINKPEFVNELAVYLAGLAPGELNGASIDAIEWNKVHDSK
jgi:NAD(P)-dependent dehydrogenase (short-subunit alcohol dehydrogenase family)